MLAKFLSILYPKKLFIFVSACFLTSFCLILLSRTVDGFAQWYAVSIYPVFLNLIGRIFSLWDHSFFKTGTLLLIMTAAAMILAGIAVLFRRNSWGKAYRSFCLRFLSRIIAVLVLIAATKSVNDLYLKANAQIGTKSYEHIVDLLLADYADRIDTTDLI